MITIKATSKTGEVEFFSTDGKRCPDDHITTVIKEYFEITDEGTPDDQDNADLHLFGWGIERIVADIDIGFQSKLKKYQHER